MELQDFFSKVDESSKFKAELCVTGGFINFANSGQRGSIKKFTLSLNSLISGLEDMKGNHEVFSLLENYDEGKWRDAGAKYFTDLVLNSMITVQTKPCFTTFSKIIHWANEITETFNDNQIDLGLDSLNIAISRLRSLSSNLTVKANESNEDQFISWLSKNNKTQKYLSSLRAFWNFIEDQRARYSSDFSAVFNSNSILMSLYESKDSLFNMSKQDLDKLTAAKPFLNKREGDVKQGGSPQHAGLRQLIEWRESTESPDEIDYEKKDNQIKNKTVLSKPFLLLAGLSGTGKTRFVRKQAEMTGSLDSTYCLVSVRPDWHEPSDLLGYVSRLGNEGAEFITTDVLNFIVKAWIGMVDLSNSFQGSEFEWKPKGFGEIRPFWLCLDEMNLAPVEQYFADYLSVLETRKWEEGVYSCEPLLKPDNFKQLEQVGQVGQAGLDKLRNSLELGDKKYQGLWDYFVEKGISIPFNLIVAGTVNMDETTHGFSRKVIDRALTFDFGAFFPNDFDQFFERESEFKILTYPQISQAERADFSDAGHADLTIEFMKEVNGVLKGSLFELAYRALNECLIAVSIAEPKDNRTLQAVWDDFLMMKVLPRIEGDMDKLQSQNAQTTDKTILDDLEAVLETQLNEIWADDSVRPDLFRVGVGEDSIISVKCRSKEKIKRMKKLLDSGFTSFWP